jgi:hypothetical protein
LSPTVTGRFLAAAAQSSVPVGWKETFPSKKLMRATRDGGSLSSSACALGAIKSNRPDKHISRTALLFPTKVAFIFVSPVSGRLS